MAKECKDCGASGEEVRISKKGLCPRCGMKRAGEAAYQLAAKEGPYYERWKLGMQWFFDYVEEE